MASRAKISNAVSDFLAEVAKGRVDGHSLVSVVGFNADIDIAAEESVWDSGGLHAFPAAAGVVSVVSGSGFDSAAGTGARTVRVTGLNALYVEISEDVILNGATPVLTVAQFLRATARVLTAGSSGSNTGTITGTISAVAQFAIPASQNRSQGAHFTVPAATTAHLISASLQARAATANAAFARLVARPFGGVFETRDHFACNTQQPGVPKKYDAPMVFPAKTDLQMLASTLVDNATITARLDLLLIADAYL